MAIVAKTYPKVLKYGLQQAYNEMAVKDPSVLYFCTDTKKIYKGDIDFSESVRVVASKPVSPAVGITYVIGDTGAVEMFDGTNWKVISYPTVTTIDVDSTDTSVASAKAVYDFVQATLEDRLGIIPEASEATTIVGYVDEQVAKATGDASQVAQDLAAYKESNDKAVADTNKRIDDLGTAADADVSTTEIAAEGAVADTLPTVAQVKKYVTDSVKDLEGAMHFVGVTTREEGETDLEAIARVITAPVAGDVTVMADNAKEYIYNGTNWQEVGDENLYVKKSTQIAGVDLNDSITKEELLTALNVADGAQVNVLEGVKVNGTELSIDEDKKVDITVTTGETNGTVKVNGAEVAVAGLGSAAFTNSDAYDAAGSAQAAQEAVQANVDQVVADLAALAEATTVWGTF